MSDGPNARGRAGENAADNEDERVQWGQIVVPQETRRALISIKMERVGAWSAPRT